MNDEWSRMLQILNQSIVKWTTVCRLVVYILGRNDHYSKVGCVSLMAISSEFRMGKYWDDDHREDAPHFSLYQTDLQTE